MSATITDFAKVTQMLDSGWSVTLFKGALGSYEVRAMHQDSAVMSRVRKLLAKEVSPDLLKELNMTSDEAVDEFHFHDDWLMTDDFTPQQALTRMAYKVHGEVIQ